MPIEEVNDAITFEQSTFRKIDQSQEVSKYHADSVSTTLGQQGSTLEWLEREHTHTHIHTDRETLTTVTLLRMRIGLIIMKYHHYTNLTFVCDVRL